VILGILDHLPGGNTLCHGDFHPGNILHSNGRDYIIDWSGASRGDIAADVAHTYILLKVVPRVPGIGLFMHAIQKQLGNAMASIYLKSTMKSMSLNPAMFSKWVLIKAAERTYYGLPSEKQRLQTFIAKYVDALSQGRNEDHSYKWI
jgi:aminoglycoside phosphotransferase (APT) family kinase protein